MTLRLFTALAVPAPWRAVIEAAREEMPGLRWSPPVNLHLTLCFLGAVDASRLPDIAARLEEGPQPSEIGPLALGAVECWPNRAVVARVAGTAALDALVASQEAELRALGIALSSRPYRPHVTLARVKHGIDEACLAEWRRRYPVLAAPPGFFSDFGLYASRPGEDGVRYERLLSMALSA